MPVILSTRKLDDEQQRRILSQGFSLLQHDFISVEKIDFQVNFFEYEYLIFTSQNAVKSVVQSPFFEDLVRKKVLCVGQKTKKLLKTFGWDVIESVPYAQMLAQIITQKYRQNTFLFFCGNQRRDVLVQAMHSAHITFSEIQVYKTQKTPVRIETSYDAILFFSPSGVESFLSQNNIMQQRLFCIGTTTAQSLSKYSAQVFVAEKQTIESTIDCCIKNNI